MQNNGTTASAVCDKLGIARATLPQWRNGSSPREETISRVAQHFGVSSAYMLGMPDVLPIRVETVGAEEKELLRIYKLLDTKGRTLLLARAYELEEKNGQL